MPSLPRNARSRRYLRGNIISHLPTKLAEVGEKVLRSPDARARRLLPRTKRCSSYIPIDSARHYGFVPLDKVDGALEIGITDPDNIEALDALQFISGKIGIPYKIFLITEQDLNRVIEAYQNLSVRLGARFLNMRPPSNPPLPARACLPVARARGSVS